MVDVFDVAKWFLSKESMTHKKLQKLCYYAQAWHYTLLGEPLFADEVQAWIHGPVIPALYNKYSKYGWRKIPQSKKKSFTFTPESLDILETVVNTYIRFDGDTLECITHAELPWQEARKGLHPMVACTKPITLKSMKDFYQNLYEKEQGE